MRRLFLALACSALAASAQFQPPSPTSQLADVLSFEAPNSIGQVDGWGGTLATISLDKQIVHGGQASARIERTPSSPGEFSTLTKAVAIDFSGQRIQIRGWLRTEDVSGWVGLWMREDGETPGLEFNNMQARQIKGTTAWTEYTFVLPLNPRRER